MAYDLAAGFSDTAPDTDLLSFSTTSTLPAGLSLSATGQLTGTLDHLASDGSPYVITITATDAQGATVDSTFTLTVGNPAPLVAAGGIADVDLVEAQSGVSIDAGAVFSDADGARVDDADLDTLSFNVTGLPVGLDFDPDTGLITGDLPVGVNQNGTFSVTVTATDQQGATASTSFTIGIENQAPVIAADLPDQSYTDGVAIPAFDLTPGFTDNGDGLTLSITGGALPAGLSLVNGVITGTPTLDASQGGPDGNGIYTITVIATDSDNATSTPQTLTLTVANPVPTAGTIPTQTAVDGQTVSFDAAAAGGFADEDVLAYSVTGLPAGFAIDAATGVITGTFANTASTNAPFTVSVTATDNEGGTVIRSFTWTVSNPAPVAGVIANLTVDDASNLSVNAGSVFSDPDGDALFFDATGLPEGLQIDPLTGIVSGTLESNASQFGPYLITVVATDADGDRAESTFTITALNTPVTATGTIPDIIANLGQGIPATGQDIFSDLDGDDLVITASQLPEGLQIDSQSGVISGSIARTAEPGDYIVTVTATDGEGSTASVDFVITVLAEGFLTPENFVSDGYTPSSADALQKHIPDNGSERIATTVLLDSLNSIQSIDMFGVTGTDAPINDTNDHLNDLQSQLLNVFLPDFTNTFPIPLASVEGEHVASGFTANVLISADRIFYNIEAANGSKLELDPEYPPAGVFIAPQGGIVVERWVSEPFVVTIKTINGDEVTYSDVRIDPQQNQFEIIATEVRKLLISERLERAPGVY